ncbi:uncharacterized protein RAG0_17349 [Rhynchosporium agropyri]|uniref:Uncharacterized protein n=1 Tax=Rhynchosporium agropyri TaxID=914238 RepID=A0A1E1LTT3_9HELO|nr:uncharacterized protein RAG0_17349 [Rhynchosporium agropyri]
MYNEYDLFTAAMNPVIDIRRTLDASELAYRTTKLVKLLLITHPLRAQCVVNAFQSSANTCSQTYGE